MFIAAKIYSCVFDRERQIILFTPRLFRMPTVIKEAPSFSPMATITQSVSLRGKVLIPFRLVESIINVFSRISFNLFTLSRSESTPMTCCPFLDKSIANSEPKIPSPIIINFSTFLSGMRIHFNLLGWNLLENHKLEVLCAPKGLTTRKRYLPFQQT